MITAESYRDWGEVDCSLTLFFFFFLPHEYDFFLYLEIGQHKHLHISSSGACVIFQAVLVVIITPLSTSFPQPLRTTTENLWALNTLSANQPWKGRQQIRAIIIMTANSHGYTSPRVVAKFKLWMWTKSTVTAWIILTYCTLLLSLAGVIGVADCRDITSPSRDSLSL